MRIDKALAELRSLEQRKRGKIDDESVPFLAYLRNGGLLNDEDWLALQAYMADTIVFLRQSAQKQGGPIDVDGDPRNANWIQLVRIFRLTKHKLPGWATLWLRRLHPNTDAAFWRNVARLADELGLPSTTKPATQMETRVYGEVQKTPWYSVSEPPSCPGFYDLREKGSDVILDGRYEDHRWFVAFGSPAYRPKYEPLKVAHSRLEWRQKPVSKMGANMYMRFAEGHKTPWYSVSEPPARPGIYELRKKGSHDISNGQYADGRWDVPFDGRTEWRGLISDPRTLPKDYVSLDGRLSFVGFR
jgi:hypothetical protein